MSLNPDLPRWVTASVAKHIESTIETTLSMQFFVEGVDREQKEWFQEDSAVLRVTGPLFRPGSGRDCYKFEVMVMVTDLLTDSADAFLNHDRLGTIANVLCSPIPVLKYGGDQSQVGCLDIDPAAAEFLRIVHFGRLDPNTEVIQAAVVVKYEICL